MRTVTPILEFLDFEALNIRFPASISRSSEEMLFDSGEEAPFFDSI